MIFRPFYYFETGCAAYVLGCGGLGLCAVVAAVLDRAGSAARSEPASRASAPPALPQLALDVDATQATLTVPATPDAMKRSS